MNTLIKPLHNFTSVRMFSFWPAFLFLMFAQIFSLQVAFSQGTGSTVAGFEVDASFKSGFIPTFWKTSPPNQNYSGGLGDDWSKGTTGNAVLKQLGGVSVPGLTADRTAIWQIDGNWGTNVPPDMSVFAGSSNKNGDLIGAGQSPYAIGTGSGGPQKNDITNVMLHTRRVGNNLWLFFAAETRSINGSSYLDFEYNQAGVTTDGGSMIGLGLVGGRTVNDILMVVNYTQGGKTPIVGVRRWQADGTWSAELPLTAGNSFMTTNTLAVDAVAPNASYLGDGTPANSSLAFQVVEGALNVSSLNLEGLDQCTPNATVTVKTRSSASYTSELKDWDILHFPLTPAAVAAVADITPQCESKTGPTIFNVAGTYADGTPVWSSSAGTSLSNQTYVGGVATATLSVPNGIYNATVTLTTSSPNENCPDATSTKSAVVYPNPTVVAGASPAGPVSIGSLPPHYSLSTTVNAILNNAGFNYSWVQDPPAGGSLSDAAIANPSFTATIAGTYDWTVTATDKITGCFNSSTVQRVIASTAGCPTVPTSPVCSGTTNNYTADVAPATHETWIWSANNGATVNAPNGGQSVSVTAGTQNFTLTLTKKFANTNLADVVCNYPVTLNPNEDPPSTEYIGPECTEKTFKVKITNPVVGSTYTLVQLDGNEVVIGPYVSGDLIFEDLHIGEGYSVSFITAEGCSSDADECGDFSSPAPQNVNTAPIAEMMSEEKLSVKAAPNPFNDRIRFSIKSPETGQGSLELYNMLGQKVNTIYRGNVQKGMIQHFEYSVPSYQRTNLIYVFRVNSQRVSGTLIGLK